MKSNLDIINEVDVFPYEDVHSEAYERIHNGLYTLLWKDERGSYPIGFMLDRVVRELPKVPSEVRGTVHIDEERRTVSLFQDLPTEAERSRQAAALAKYWRSRDVFPQLRGWRNELLPIYGRTGELLFSIERAALGLLGAMRYGIHMIAYVRGEDGALRLWIPRRAADKSTFPGMLDNTVAGGLATGEIPGECVVREADEEASLPEALVRDGAKELGVATYIYITTDKDNKPGEEDGGGYIYPECQWVYDLELPADVVPEPQDGEVDEFMLCSVDEVKAQLARGEFKPNCALVTIDFFIRHGILDATNEPHLDEIRHRMHRKMPFPGPHEKEKHTS